MTLPVPTVRRAEPGAGRPVETAHNRFRVDASAPLMKSHTPAVDDLRERGSISRGHLLRPGGAGVRGGRVVALDARPQQEPTESRREVPSSRDLRKQGVSGSLLSAPQPCLGRAYAPPRVWRAARRFCWSRPVRRQFVRKVRARDRREARRVRTGLMSLLAPAGRSSVRRSPIRGVPRPSRTECHEYCRRDRNRRTSFPGRDSRRGAR